MKILKNIAWSVLAIWGIALLVSVFVSDKQTSDKTEVAPSVVAQSPVAETTEPVTSQASGKPSDLTCYPYKPIVEGDRISANFNGSGCVGYFNAYALATNSGNAAVLKQLNDPELQLYIENVAKLADIIEESCPRDGLAEELKGYQRGKEILEMNIALVKSGSMPLSTIQERAKQCQSVYEYYGGILNKRLAN